MAVVSEAIQPRSDATLLMVFMQLLKKFRRRIGVFFISSAPSRILTATRRSLILDDSLFISSMYSALTAEKFNFDRIHAEFRTDDARSAIGVDTVSVNFSSLLLLRNLISRFWYSF